jgi:prepilin-type N-terminal cleavage/methylation domain-containing protein
MKFGRNTRKTMRQRGFSMVETLVTVAVILSISGMIIVRMQPTLQEMRANGGVAQVVGAFRTAREYAVTYRRYVQVTFPGYPGTNPNQIRITALNHLTQNAGNDVIITTLTLTGTVTIQRFAGLPATPDAFGDTTAVNFGGVDGGPTAGMMFQPDGTFVDTFGNYVNGTVFLGITSFQNSPRAITVLGSTGHVKAYRGTPTQGSTTGSWLQMQ